jgi:hypothetical protein
MWISNVVGSVGRCPLLVEDGVLAVLAGLMIDRDGCWARFLGFGVDVKHRAGDDEDDRDDSASTKA